MLLDLSEGSIGSAKEFWVVFVLNKGLSYKAFFEVLQGLHRVSRCSVFWVLAQERCAKSYPHGDMLAIAGLPFIKFLRRLRAVECKDRVKVSGSGCRTLAIRTFVRKAFRIEELRRVWD